MPNPLTRMAAVAAIALVLVSAACGGEPTDPAGPTGPETTVPETTAASSFEMGPNGYPLHACALLTTATVEETLGTSLPTEIESRPARCERGGDAGNYGFTIHPRSDGRESTEYQQIVALVPEYPEHGTVDGPWLEGIYYREHFGGYTLIYKTEHWAVITYLTGVPLSSSSRAAS